MRIPFALLPFALLAACDDHDAGPPPGSPCADRQQVSLPACESGQDAFSDEACIPFDDALRNNRQTTSDARSPSITAPTEMQAVPAATPFTFGWDAPMAWRPRARPMTVADELGRLLTLLPEAHAHCPPFNGRAYELQLRAGSALLLRRQQSATSWTPTAAEWAYLTRAIGRQTATLTIFTATFVNTQISAGSGPFTPTAARRFTVTE